MKTDYPLIFFSAITIILWGLWGFFGKLALDRNMSPVTIFFAEVVISVLCALILFIFLLPQTNVHNLYNTWNVFGLISGAGLAFGLLFYYFALSKGNASIVVPLTATYPIVSALMSYAFLGERPRLIQWIGIILVIIGAALLLSGPVAKTSTE